MHGARRHTYSPSFLFAVLRAGYLLVLVAFRFDEQCPSCDYASAHVSSAVSPRATFARIQPLGRDGRRQDRVPGMHTF